MNFYGFEYLAIEMPLRIKKKTALQFITVKVPPVFHQTKSLSDVLRTLYLSDNKKRWYTF